MRSATRSESCCGERATSWLLRDGGADIVLGRASPARNDPVRNDPGWGWGSFRSGMTRAGPAVGRVVPVRQRGRRGRRDRHRQVHPPTDTHARARAPPPTPPIISSPPPANPRHATPRPAPPPAASDGRRASHGPRMRPDRHHLLRPTFPQIPGCRPSLARRHAAASKTHPRAPPQVNCPAPLQDSSGVSFMALKARHSAGRWPNQARLHGAGRAMRKTVGRRRQQTT